MPDHIDRYTDQQEAAYAKKIADTYKQAAQEVRRQITEFTAKHKAKAAKLLQQVNAGEISMADYQAWLQGQVFIGKQWQDKLDDIVRVYTDADEKARQLMRGTVRDVFTESANYAAYQLEGRLGAAVDFHLYDAKTVDRLMRTNPQMLPEWKINEKKDYTWNEERVRSTLTRAIIQGKPIPDIADELGQQLATSNGDKMVLFARTAMTGAQNAGRIERLHDTQQMGIRVKKKWLAAHDARVRDTHAFLDGQERDVDAPFDVGGMQIMYPGDPSAPPELVYNCRCTMVYVYPQHEAEHQGEKTESYEEWLEKKKGKRDEGNNEPVEPEKPKPRHVDFTPAQSIQEAEEYARQFVSGSGSVSYRGLSLDAANACNRALADIQATYDIEALGTVQPMNMRSNIFKNTTAEAAYRWGTRDLLINPKYYKSASTLAQHTQEIDSLMQTVLGGAQKLIDSGRVTGAKRTYIEALLNTGRQCVLQSHDFVLGTFIHENGHRLDDGIFRKAIREAFGATTNTFHDMLAESRRMFGGGISGYAVTDNQEYIAESFTAWWFGEGDKCDPRIVSVFEGLIKK